MAYSALFNNVFEALNLLLIILYSYVAEIQLHVPGNAFGSSLEHRILARALPCLAIGDFHYIM
jgi:hypothetical protein